ncbi:MAG: site-2 protease family protein, partial [Thermoflexus sp.]|uniref:site-2 protease family protein n=1 Tax=Thermoflexus sp. TaxID=1969742 RepID=UPI0025EE8452
MKSRSLTFQLFTFAGTPVQVHWSLLALLGIAVAGAGALGGWQEALRQGLWWGLLFGLVLLHELGHLLAARLLRTPVTSLVLWPLGGFITVRLPPGCFSAEFVIALAGPAVNLLIALSLSALGLGGIPRESEAGHWG